MQIRPISRADITAMAHAAHDNGEPVDHANPFGSGTANWRAFNLDFFEYAIRPVACEEV